MKKKYFAIQKTKRLFSLIVLAGLFIFVTMPGIFKPIVSFAANLDDLYNQKDAANDLLEKNQNAVNEKANEVYKVSTDIDNLGNEISSAQNRINDTENQINQTQNDINSTQDEINRKQEELNTQIANRNETIKIIYENSEVNTLEVLIGSNNLSEVVNHNEYLDALEQKIEDAMTVINKLKTDLENKKVDLVKKQTELQTLKEEQEANKRSLQIQQDQKNSLLNMTLAQKNAYEDQVNQLKNQIKQISDAIYAERQRLLRQNIKEALGDGSSGYPYSAIDEPDAWGFLTRECTSYAAWYWNMYLGKPFTNVLGRGNASDWPALAAAQGYSVSSTPQSGAIISWSSGSLMPYGHVAIVEAVHSDGTIDLSEYNWFKYSYSNRLNVNPASYGSYSYIY